MSEPVISLTSSDEEDNLEPPPKRKKTVPSIIPKLPQVTLTLVPNSKKKENPIETVTLDSDDEVDPNLPKPTSTSFENCKQSKLTASKTDKADLISLIDVDDDDEEDDKPPYGEVGDLLEPICGTDKADSIDLTKINGSIVRQVENETVSIIDSDSDAETNDEKPSEKHQNKQSEETAEIAKDSTTDTNENIVSTPVIEEIAEETDKKGLNFDQANNENDEKEIENDSNKSNDKDVKETNKENINEESHQKTSNEVKTIIETVDLLQNLSEETSNEVRNTIETRTDEHVEKEPQREEPEDILPNVNGKEKHNDSIVINDSDDDTGKENNCEIVDSELFSVTMEKTSANDVPVPSTSFKGECAGARILFKKFLKMFEEKIVDSSFEEILPKKVPVIEKYFKRCGTYVEEKTFETLMNQSIESIRKAPNSKAAYTSVLAFHKIFEHLKSRVAENTIEIEEDDLPQVKKLEKHIKLLRKKIKQLEETEVDFDEEENSTYIKLDKFQARLNKVYAKYCKYIRKDPYKGRAIYDKICFVNSKYNVINQALSKKYRNSVNFPSYYELEHFIEKTVKKENLLLSDQEIKHESKKSFKYLGELLQKKRRQELHDSHVDFIDNTEDPATKDISLENVLKKNYLEGKNKIEKIYQKYVDKQEQGEGEEHVSSDETETSGASDSKENNRETEKEGARNVKKKGLKKFDKGSRKKSETKMDENKVTNCNGVKDSCNNEENNRNITSNAAEHAINEVVLNIRQVDEGTDVQSHKEET